MAVVAPISLRLSPAALPGRSPPRSLLTLITVPVEAAYQVLRVARVLSMGIVHNDVQGVPEKSCQIKPWENFEKMQF